MIYDQLHWKPFDYIYLYTYMYWILQNIQISNADDSDEKANDEDNKNSEEDDNLDKPVKETSEETDDQHECKNESKNEENAERTDINQNEERRESISIRCRRFDTNDTEPRAVLLAGRIPDPVKSQQVSEVSPEIISNPLLQANMLIVNIAKLKRYMGKKKCGPYTR